MTLNENKTVRGVERINILGYEIEKGRIAQDKNRLQPLLDMFAPKTLKDLKQVSGLFAYYAKWIADFSAKIKRLTETEVFPLSTKARAAFELLKKDLGNVTLMSIDETQDFTVETDASNVAISATLNQNGKPVAFFSKTLNASQKLFPSVEKEAMSIVEAIKHWSHFLGRKKFKLITDQRPVAYMFDNFRRSKIKKKDRINLNLEENIDIINYVSNHNSLRPKLVIGFAAETNDIKNNAKKKLMEKNCDWIIANDVSNKSIGFDSDFNEVTIFYKDNEINEEKLFMKRKSEISDEIINRVISQLN